MNSPNTQHPEIDSEPTATADANEKPKTALIVDHCTKYFPQAKGAGHSEAGVDERGFCVFRDVSLEVREGEFLTNDRAQRLW